MEVAFKSFMAAEYIHVLSTKTKRGMRMAAEAGKATGSRLSGWISASFPAKARSERAMDAQTAGLRRAS
jgi:DNA invertase Pin-like site-specific DNA recombinase